MTINDPGVDLMQMISGLWVSQSVATIARLGVPDKLKEGARSAEDLAGEVGCNGESLHRMMRALSKVGVFEETPDGAFALTAVSDLLRDDHERSLRWMAVAQCDPGHWRPWGHAHDAVMSGEPQASKVLGHEPWDYLQRNPQEAGRFGQAMSNLSSLAIGAITQSYDFTPFKKIVDIGGSHGTLLSAILDSAPEAQGILFDLPPVIELAGKKLESSPNRSRIELSAGSFFDSVPEGGDLYVMKHIIHDWNDDKAKEILETVRKAIPEHGKLQLFDAVLAPEAPPFAFWLDVHMMVMLDGKERTPEEFGALFASAGFELVNIQPTPSPVAIIEAKPV